MKNEKIKIVSLEAESVKKIRAVRLQFSPEGLTIIGGKNRNGKTSVLDAIGYALGGEKRRPSNLKNEGSEKDPFLRLELSNGIVVERKGKNSSLKVTDPEGKKSGQTLLNAFVSEFSLDIEKFLNSDPTKKRSLILKALGNEEQLAKLESEEKEASEERTLKGREVKRLEGSFESILEYTDAPKERLSREDIAEEYKTAIEENGKIQERAAAVEEAHKQTTKADLDLAEALELKKQLEERLEKSIEVIKRKKLDLENARNFEDEKIFESEIDSRIDVSEISERLQNLDSENAKIDANEKKESARVDLREAQTEYNSLSDKIEKIRSDKKSVVNAAEAKLPGLSWDGEELSFNGQKWDGMSGAERMIVATSISRVLSPDSGFVLIDKLEQLDGETLEDFGKWLQEEELQAIGTRVSTGEECSFILEDGELSK